MKNAFFQTEGTYTPDQLVAGMVLGGLGTIANGAGTLLRGTLLGRVTKGAAAVAIKAGGNTGNGTLTLDADTPVLAGAKVGLYRVRCIAAAADGGTLRVTDPDGYVIGDVAVGTTHAVGVMFATADGSADLAVGDGWDITIAAGSGKLVKSLAAAVDGSDEPCGILGEDACATSADVAAIVYEGGVFNAGFVIFGAGHTAASVKDVLHKLGIRLLQPVAA